MKVLVIQPTVPHYRKEFFEKASLGLPGGLIIQCARSDPGGLESIDRFDITGIQYQRYGNFKRILNGQLHWQTNLSLDGLARADVLVLCGNPRFLSNYPVLWQAHRRGLGVVWWGHGWSSTSSRLTAYIRRQLMKFADVILLYTEAERQEYIAAGFECTRLFATNNSMGTAAIEEAKDQWSAVDLALFQEENDLKDRDVLLFCGRLTEKSGFPLLLEALCKVIRRNPSALLVVVGEGELFAAAKQQCRSLGISEKVMWLGAIHEELQLAPWFISAKCLVYPGSIGLSLLHAFNYGLPVITHNNRKRHNPEIAALDNGKNGILYEEGSADRLAEGILSVLEQPGYAAQLGEAALATVQERYCTGRMVEGFLGAVACARAIAFERALGSQACWGLRWRHARTRNPRS